MDVARRRKGSPEGGQFAPRPAPDWAAEMSAGVIARVVRLYDEADAGAAQPMHAPPMPLAAQMFDRAAAGKGPVAFTPLR